MQSPLGVLDRSREVIPATPEFQRMADASSWHPQEAPKILERCACSSFLWATSSCGGRIGHLPIKARKRHININSFVRLVLGRPRVCPGISPGSSLGQIRWKPGTSPGFLLILHSGSPISPGLSLGTNPVCPWDKPGDEGRHRKFMWKKFMCLFRSLPMDTTTTDVHVDTGSAILRMSVPFRFLWLLVTV